MSGIVGTSSGNDTLTFKTGAEYLAGLAGDDTLNIGSQGLENVLDMLGAFGGGGNDTYVLSQGSFTLIADSGGNDTLVLPFTTSELSSYLQDTTSEAHHGVIDGSHYYVYAGGVSFFIKDFLASGKLETISLSDGYPVSFDALWSQIKGIALPEGSISDLEDAEVEMFGQFFALQDILTEAEQRNAAVDVADWFESGSYIDRKLVLSPGVTEAEMVKSFEDSGFFGAEGEYLHFEMYGQWEDVPPMPLFDPDYYYHSKAADFYGINITQVADNQAAEMRNAIHNAGMNAWSHYVRYGTREGIDASAEFDTSAYVAAKLAQVRQSDSTYTESNLLQAFENANLSALGHYEAFGEAEGIPIIGVQASNAEVLTADAE